MYVIAKTKEKGVPTVFVTPSNWIFENKVLWPDVKGNKLMTLIKKREKPQQHWTSIEDVKILCKNIDNYEHAREKEKYYCKFTNTDSELEYMRKKTEKRQHPSTLGNLENINFDKNFEGNESKRFRNNDTDSSLNKENTPRECTTPSPLTGSPGSSLGLPLTPRAFHSPSSGNSLANVFRTVSHHYIDENSYKVENMKAKENLAMTGNILEKSRDMKIKKKHGKEKDIIFRKINEMEKKLDDFIKTQTYEMKNLHNKVDYIFDAIQSLMASTQTTKNKNIKKDENFQPPQMPFKVMSELEAFNVNLTNNKNLMEQMIIHLEVFVNSNLRKSVKIIMKKIISLDLITNFTWTGKCGIQGEKTKPAFSELHGVIELMEKILNYKKSFEKENISKEIKEFVKRGKQNLLREKAKEAAGK